MKKFANLTNDDLALLSPNEIEVLEYIDGKLSGEKPTRPACLAKDFDVLSVIEQRKKEAEDNANYAKDLEGQFV
ncbi:MAG: hypothetical protein E7107_09955 [Prevotella sp.]|nr:hypothetical protein [Prevotella sp.]